MFSAVWEARSEAKGCSNFVSMLELEPPLSEIEISSNLVFFSSLRFSCWSTYFCWAPGLSSSRNLILTVLLTAGAGVDCPARLINHYRAQSDFQNNINTLQFCPAKSKQNKPGARTQWQPPIILIISETREVILSGVLSMSQVYIQAIIMIWPSPTSSCLWVMSHRMS